MSTTPLTLKGFRDFLPDSMRVRNYVKNIFIQTFEQFGFEPLETPTLEYASTLMGKYGDEADKLVYQFEDNGDRLVGLRYDLTVPTAKVLAIYQNQIKLPFKRYQIQSVWRADKPQKGRYREFTQSDIDIFGPTSPALDAEIVAIIYTILQKLEFKKYQIKINSRPVLYQILEKSGITTDQNSMLQSIDKLDKIGEDGVTKELISKGLGDSQSKLIFEYIKTAQPDEYLQKVLDQIYTLGVPKDIAVFSPTIVRGLDYYTGPIFETYVQQPLIGSITGGGRYDNLVKTLGGPDIPAVGTTLGFDRIVDCILDQKLLPQLTGSTTKVMVANFGSDTQVETSSLVNFLRSLNINTLYYPYPDKLGKQFAYASNKLIPFVAVIGPDEAKSGQIMLKNMIKKEQKLITQSEILTILS